MESLTSSGVGGGPESVGFGEGGGGEMSDGNISSERVSRQSAARLAAEDIKQPSEPLICLLPS